jgi:general secretion pathway protein K
VSRRGQGGVALVLVMWVAVLLTVIASSFIIERRTEWLIVRNSASLARADAAATAGIMAAVQNLYRGDTSAERWQKNGVVHDWSFDNVPVRVVIRDESAKIDINTGAEPLLRGLFISTGLPEDEAAQLVDAILDWRDADSLKRPRGAEEADYRAAGLPYKPANEPFQAIEELQLVLGMRPEIYRRIAPSITVFSRQPGINVHLASRDVLMALPGIAPQVVDDFIAQREAARAAGQPLPPLPEAGALAAGTSMIATIHAEARMDDGVSFGREAAALLRPAPRRAVSFISWRESTASPAAASAEPSAAVGGTPLPQAPR